MQEPAGEASDVRFGVFQADFRTGELWKRGVRIKLQGKPFQLLAALIERPGEVMTRDELRQTLWGDQTFVDFERGLNIAITKLRRALGDSAESPRFIETLPRRGYRFIAPPPLARPCARRTVMFLYAQTGVRFPHWALPGREMSLTACLCPHDNRPTT